MYCTSSDLEIMEDVGAEQRAIGLRFTGLNLDPANMELVSAAVLRLTADGTNNNGRVSVEIRAERSALALGCSTPALDYTQRPLTSSVVSWDNLTAWNGGSTYDSPDLSALLNELFRGDLGNPVSGWTTASPVSLVITPKAGNVGFRRAFSFSGGTAAQVPELRVSVDCAAYTTTTTTTTTSTTTTTTTTTGGVPTTGVLTTGIPTTGISTTRAPAGGSTTLPPATASESGASSSSLDPTLYLVIAFVGLACALCLVAAAFLFKRRDPKEASATSDSSKSLQLQPDESADGVVESEYTAVPDLLKMSAEAEAETEAEAEAEEPEGKAYSSVAAVSLDEVQADEEGNYANVTPAREAQLRTDEESAYGKMPTNGGDSIDTAQTSGVQSAEVVYKNVADVFAVS
jgi:hypothetical protein